MLKTFAIFFFLVRSFMYAEKLFSSWNVWCAYVCLLVHILCLPSFLVKGYDGLFTKDLTSDLLLLTVYSVLP